MHEIHGDKLFYEYKYTCLIDLLNNITCHGCDSHDDVRQPGRMNFAESSVNSELIFMTFSPDNRP